ncbi:YdeI family protein [Amnibacterium sp.]|uniref:YdeI/OmpD-associated family protein n=1 Tax=Amnibacterium sp. TaxID=1872496 RepID=UPI00263044A5|nr:YdeI/OmpD-associated family protein [Amnibacterium sp.]MCU1473102.1 bacteriocin-protection protein YdeI/OmpD-associated family [Amnibacterium sp.]
MGFVIDRPMLVVADAAEWEEWLERHGAEAAGVRLAIPKKGTGGPGPTAAEALDVALCFGWIDSRIDRLDDVHYTVTYTPRGARSVWSRINREHIERLTAAGRMRPAGLAQVEAAKADGRWAAAYPSQSGAAVPDDLAAALAARPAAAAAFDRLDAANRYAIVWRVGQAKRAETRARRIEEFLAMLERGEVLHPPRRRSAP